MFTFHPYDRLNAILGICTVALQNRIVKGRLMGEEKKNMPASRIHPVRSNIDLDTASFWGVKWHRSWWCSLVPSGKAVSRAICTTHAFSLRFMSLVFIWSECSSRWMLEVLKVQFYPPHRALTVPQALSLTCATEARWKTEQSNKSPDNRQTLTGKKRNFANHLSNTKFYVFYLVILLLNIHSKCSVISPVRSDFFFFFHF